MDTLIVCRFYRYLYSWKGLSTLIQAATVLDLNGEAMRCIAINFSSATRRFNIQEGLKPEGDKLPHRFHTDVLHETQNVIAEEQMDRLLRDHYRVRG